MLFYPVSGIYLSWYFFFLVYLQGTIMGLASFTMPETVEMVQAAALLCPISYLNHISSSLILTAVNLHLDQV